MAEPLNELLDRCRQGDGEAIARLVGRFWAWACDLAAALLDDSHLAEDAVQAAFLSAINRLYDLRDPNAFAGWFRQIVRTEALRIVRKRRERPLDREVAESADEPSPAEHLERAERRQVVRQAIASLPKAGRETAEMFYLDDLGHADIADRLGVPMGTVKRRLHDVRWRLRSMLLGYVVGPEPPEAERITPDKQLPL